MDQGTADNINNTQEDVFASQESQPILPQTDNRQEQLNDSSFIDEFSGFSEQKLSTAEAPPIEDDVQDRFDGIFYYNVISDENRFSILFSTKELYTKFVNNLQKGFHPKQQQKDMITLTTRVQRKKCIITLYETESTVTAKGPGCKLWRETTFSRLATRLCRNFEMETNQQIEEHKNSTTFRVSSQSSTPTAIRNPHIDVLWSPVQSQQPSEHLLTKVSETQTDIKGQISSLVEIILNLQEQVS